MPVKSVPGCLVTIAPSLIGAPAAFCPVPSPHCAPACAALLPPPAETARITDAQLTRARSERVRRLLMVSYLLHRRVRTDHRLENAVHHGGARGSQRRRLLLTPDRFRSGLEQKNLTRSGLPRPDRPLHVLCAAQ